MSESENISGPQVCMFSWLIIEGYIDYEPETRNKMIENMRSKETAIYIESCGKITFGTEIGSWSK